MSLPILRATVEGNLAPWSNGAYRLRCREDLRGATRCLMG
jgi:hypothetical protein